MDGSTPNLLIAGLPRSGKSSIARVVFQQTPPHETFHYEGFHNNVEVIPVECGGSFLKFLVAVLPGSFVLDVERAGAILSSSSSSLPQHRRGETTSSSSYSSPPSSSLPCHRTPPPSSSSSMYLRSDHKHPPKPHDSSLSKTTGRQDLYSSFSSSSPTSHSHCPSSPSCIVTNPTADGGRASCSHVKRTPSHLSPCLHPGVSSPPHTRESEGAMGDMSHKQVFLHKSEADYFGLGEFALDVVERLHEQIQDHLSFHLSQEISPPSPLPSSSSRSQENHSSSSFSSFRSLSPSTRDMKPYAKEGEGRRPRVADEESEEEGRRQGQRRIPRESPRGSCEIGKEHEGDLENKRFSAYKTGEDQSSRSDSGRSSSSPVASSALTIENRRRSSRGHKHVEKEEEHGNNEEEEDGEEGEEGRNLLSSISSASGSSPTRDETKSSLKNCHAYEDLDQLASSSSTSCRLTRLSFSATCLYDSSIFQGCSRSVQRLFRHHEVCTELLDGVVASCRMDKALLFDSAVRLCLASDSSPFDSSLFELAAEVVDVARELKAVYSPPPFEERPQWFSSPFSNLPPSRPPSSSRPSSLSLDSSTPSSSLDEDEEEEEREEREEEEEGERNEEREENEEERERRDEKEEEEEDRKRRREAGSGGGRKSLEMCERTSYARREEEVDEGGEGRKAGAIEGRDSQREDVEEQERKMERRRRKEEEEEGRESLQGEEGEQDKEEKGRRKEERKGCEGEKEHPSSTCETQSSYLPRDRSGSRRRDEEEEEEEEKRDNTIKKKKREENRKEKKERGMEKVIFMMRRMRNSNVASPQHLQRGRRFRPLL
ncbi:gtr1 protein g [Cystoisospora suis]|uniref:Gtr1 protein g n=1 Tax=Cystoisospora suis TaxID=483139 RepID=A0A2C6L6D4_9APIC|nr:gtr1 protein g [Cystoisospora suis]